jgi:hypothetical protein
VRTRAISSGAPTATPPVLSLWPPRYLVADCTTTSTPCSSGRTTAGEVNVASTTSWAPASCAMPARPGRSATDSVGLASVSAHTTAVSGRTAARTASRSVPSTKVVDTPKRCSTPVSSAYVPP